MTLSRRLLFTLFVALLALVFVGSLGLWRLYQAQQRFEKVQTNIIPSINELGEIRADIAGYSRLSYQYILSDGDAGRAAAEVDGDALDKVVDQRITTYQQSDLSDDTDRQMLDIDKTSLAAYRETIRNLRARVRDGDSDGAKAMLIDGGATRNAFMALSKAIANHIAYNVELGQHLREANNEAYKQAVWLLMSCMVFGLALSGGMCIQLYRAITSGLNNIQHSLQQVSSSLDLTHTAAIGRMDEIGHTAAAFNALLSRVAEVVGEVRNSAGSVSVSSRQIAIGNTDLSQRTEEQAASLEETASSMDELTSTVRQTADNARQAAALAHTASEVALQGGDVVGRVVETMHGISDSSSKMSEIIAVIEGIAFQTNILALNAAVEAARAGQEGRGFAVVAGEVRTLAQRSADAAKEIKELIDESANRVDAGSKLVDQAGAAINEVVQAVKRVSDIVGEIASASEEQRTGIEQVNQAVSQMDQVTQKNAALVEEASAAAQSLADQAKTLHDAVAVFRIDNGQRSPLLALTSQSGHQLQSPTVDISSRATQIKNKNARVPVTDVAVPSAISSDPAEWQTF
jgi:methyl-accepting chemotaxis protein